MTGLACNKAWAKIRVKIVPNSKKNINIFTDISTYSPNVAMHVRVELIITPRNLILLTCWMGILSIVTLKSLRSIDFLFVLIKNLKYN